jgi:hypothetical protein
MMIIIKVKIISHLKTGLRKDLRIHLFQKIKLNQNLADILNTKRIRKTNKIIDKTEK